MRISMSVLDPAVNGAITVMGRVGNAAAGAEAGTVWARQCVAEIAVAAVTVVAKRNAADKTMASSLVEPHLTDKDMQIAMKALDSLDGRGCLLLRPDSCCGASHSTIYRHAGASANRAVTPLRVRQPQPALSL